MKVLLDECLPRRLLRDLEGFAATTVPRQGWAGRTDSDLLKMADAEFDLFVTLDSNLVFQQNLSSTRLSIIVLHAANSRYETLQPLIPALVKAIQSNAGPGTVITIN
jgi:predicted nuclease of predicted toxin-antitoxin system